MRASLYISAAHKSSGKTVTAVGLCAAFREGGLAVQPFKKGPDYIDPGWLSLAAGRDCRNLDFHTMSETEISAALARWSAGSGVNVIEGNKGLFDGMDVRGRDSNAALAKLLRVPVVLVVDTRGMTRGIAPLLLGYQSFDHQLRIAGVVLNQVAGPRHEAKLRAALEEYTDAAVCGAIRRDDSLQITERHLGLIPGNEIDERHGVIARLKAAVQEQVDLAQMLKMAGAHAGVGRSHPEVVPASRSCDVRIGVARDASFGFYYPDDLEALRAAGAELVFINTLRDASMPRIDGLFIGGGFPETHMQALQRNRSLRGEIRDAVLSGLPAYAECGGLMYLTRSLSWQGRRCEMVGAIPADTLMHAAPQGRGYVRLRETGYAPWTLGENGAPAEFNAHEFHYSSLVNPAAGLQYAYEVLRGKGIDGCRDGIVLENTVASFAHLRNIGANRWAENFVSFVRSRRPSYRPAAAM